MAGNEELEIDIGFRLELEDVKIGDEDVDGDSEDTGEEDNVLGAGCPVPVPPKQDF
jgi:hypothetical protein